jgi:enterochelin esterase-like enzyme
MPEGCPNTESSMIDLQIPSKLLGESLLYRVYLPPCFSENPARPYPVLYLLHGQQQDATLWERLGALDLADQVALSNISQSFIIVMPTERRFLVNLQDTEYDRAIAEELIPAIDAAFPTCTDRSCRAVGGISRGGAWAVRIGFLYPDLFGFVGAHSPAVFGAELSRLPVLLNRADQSEIPVLYIDTGRADNYRESAIKLESILTEYRAIHEWHLNEGQHEFQYWQDHISDYISWYSANWP